MAHLPSPELIIFAVILDDEVVCHHSIFKNDEMRLAIYNSSPTFKEASSNFNSELILIEVFVENELVTHHFLKTDDAMYRAIYSSAPSFVQLPDNTYAELGSTWDGVNFIASIV